MLVSGVVGVYCCSVSFYDNVNVINSDKYTVTEVDKVFMRYHSDYFNYFRGLWVIPIGLFFVLLLVFCDVPSFFDAGRVLYSDFRKKFSEYSKKNR